MGGSESKLDTATAGVPSLVKSHAQGLQGIDNVHRRDGEHVPSTRILLDEPWRKSDWNEMEIKEDIEKLNPEKKPRLLLLGSVGAGKSSFINSILSIGKRRKCEIAGSGGIGTSYTLKAGQYTEKNLMRKKYHLLDSMGVEPGDEQGFHPDEVINLLKGHIKKGYMFNPKSPIEESDTHYRKNPSFKHKTHCVIFVVDAKAICSGIHPSYMKKIQDLQDKIRREEIPRILILTKVDQLCDVVEKDISKLFLSAKIYQAVRIASEVFNIAIASIHPVKNYETDFKIEPFQNIPLLLALRQSMQYAMDKAEQYIDDKKCDESDESNESDESE